MANKTKRVLKALKPAPVTRDIAGEFIIPNHSGAVRDPRLEKDIPNKKYVDDSISAISTPTHASTTGQTADDHHNEAHTHTHLSTTGQTTDDHHAEVHTHTHLSTTGRTADDHHNEVHTHTHLSTTGQTATDHHDNSEDHVQGTDPNDHAEVHNMASHSDDTTYNIDTTSADCRMKDIRFAKAGVINYIQSGDARGANSWHALHFGNYASATTKACINSAGNFGVGLTDPDQKAEIAGPIKSSRGTAANYQIVVDGYDSGGPRIYWGSYLDKDSFMTMGAIAGKNSIDTKGRDFHIFSTDIATGIFFEEDTGNVGIGTLTPSSKLQVSGAISSATAIITASSDTTNVSGINTLFVNPTDVTIVLGGLVGGVDGQVIRIVAIGSANGLTLENEEGIGGATQNFIINVGADKTFCKGGYVFVCNGTNWYDISDISWG